jgi:transcription antitermination protein NusB
MPARSRRKAREAALQALYGLEVGKAEVDAVLEETLAEAELPHDLAQFAERLVRGITAQREEIDGLLSPLITDWSFDRIAAVDRNVLRIAAFEMFHLPTIPPAVTINEAIEISKKFSTAESGKFVNGVLGKLVGQSPKADWDPSQAPAGEVEDVHHEPDPEPLEEVVEAGSEEAERLARIGGWTLRRDDSPGQA